VGRLNVQIEEAQMSLIQAKLIEEAFTPTEKKEIVAKITDGMVSIKQQNGPTVAWVDIEEVCSLEWSIGGPVRTTGAVSALAAGKK